MKEPKARELFAALNINGNPAKLSNFLDAVADAIINDKEHFTFVNTEKKLVTLAEFLNTTYANHTPVTKCLLLRNLNSILKDQKVQLLKIADSKSGFLLNLHIDTWLNTIVNNWGEDGKAVVNFLNAALKEENPKDDAARLKIVERVVLICQKAHSRPGMLKVFDLILNNEPTHAKLVTCDYINTMVRLNDRCPKGKYDGFTRWGPGDSKGTDEDNIRAHFRKHVCAIDGKGKEESIFEASWWWRALEIVPYLKRRQIETGDLGKFIEKTKTNPPLLDDLYTNFRQSYVDYAIKMSSELVGVSVELFMKEVMIGGYAGHVAIFGRYDSDDLASELGISSCYFVDKKNRAKKITNQKAETLWILK